MGARRACPLHDARGSSGSSRGCYEPAAAVVACFIMMQAKATTCSPARVCAYRSKSLMRRRKRVAHAKDRSTTHRRGRRTKPRFASGSLMTSNVMPWAAAALAACAPVDIGNIDRVAGDGLHGACEPFDLAAFFGADRRNMKREQRTQRADCHVEFRSLPALATVIAGTLAALGGGAQHPTVDDSGAGLGSAPAARRRTARRSSTRAFSNQVESPDDSGNAENQNLRAVDPMQSDRELL